MLGLLWLIPMLPLAGFVVLELFGPRLPRRANSLIGIGSVGISALLALLVALSFFAAPPPGNAYTQTLWTWMNVAELNIGISFYLDPLSLLMMVVVTFVGFLIHLYSAEYMADDPWYSRFFAYMNLFVSMMLFLVLGDNLLLLYLGWEGVGLCSYLLIGFWYEDPANGRAARKAFVVTRVGDTAMAIGFFILFTNLRTLQIQPLMQQAQSSWPAGSPLAVWAAALLLGGALGKSAQLPLQTWLPDAMAGPTPVSALIHAATMVTAGVYLIARTHVLFALAPAVLTAVAVIGALTLLIAGASALAQTDIKRALAYSTISQIGYMFLGLGVGAWTAAMFHFMTHAFFKALLFLAAGAVILAMHHEQDMRKMGGLRSQIPLTFWTFLIGAASLSAVPLITAGFYSKDLILTQAWTSPLGSPLLWLAGLVGALLTSMYSFRMVFLTFYGPAQHEVAHRPHLPMALPLVVLAFLSIVGGFVYLPENWVHSAPLADFLHDALPPTEAAPGRASFELTSQVVAAVVSLAGILIAYLLWQRARPRVRAFSQSPAGAAAARFLQRGWGFDWLYDRLFVWPYIWLAHTDRGDVFDLIYRGIAALNRGLSRGLSVTQTGRVRWYAAGIALGGIILIAIAVLL